MPIDVSGLTQSCTRAPRKDAPLTTVLTHLPKGFPRTLRLNDLPSLSHLAARCLPALFAGHCEPTARAVADRYRVNKDTAAKALNSLRDLGLLKRWRKSAGRGVWVHFAFLTDEPFVWNDDAKVVARMRRVENETLDAVREWAHTDEDATPMTAPPARQPSPVDNPGGAPADPVDNPNQEGNPRSVTCQDSSDVPMKDSSKKNLGSPVDAPPVDRFTARLVERLSRDPELDPYLPSALALLHGLGFAPMERASHGVVVATALRHGRHLGDLVKWLTTGMGSARDKAAVLRWRLGYLKSTLEAEKTRSQGR